MREGCDYRNDARLKMTAKSHIPNFSMTPHARLSVGWLVGWSVGLWVGRPVCHNFLTGREVTLPCSYWNKCLFTGFAVTSFSETSLCSCCSFFPQARGGVRAQTPNCQLGAHKRVRQLKKELEDFVAEMDSRFGGRGITIER